MFKKKECDKCGKKINDRYEFCPYCGNLFQKKYKKENLGLLGKDDFIPSINKIGVPTGFNVIFNSLMRTLDKQFNELNKEFKKDSKPYIKKRGMSINISTFGNAPPEIKVSYFGDGEKAKQRENKKIEKIISKTFSQEKIEKFSTLLRKEPKTNIRRFSNKVIYEIEMPEVKSIEDVSITKLENSIEIRAIAKNKAYFKLIPISLPITDYNFSEGKLVLELKAQNQDFHNFYKEQERYFDMQIPTNISTELAEEIGWHIGDGSMNFYKNRGKLKGFYQLRGHIEDDKKHYEKRIKPLFKKLFNIKLKIREMPSTRVIGFQIWNSDLIKFKKEFNLPLGKKYEIAIPKVFLTRINLKKSVIRGIFDTDGGIYLERKNNRLYPRLYITTTSFKLSEQLLKLFNEIGLRATRYSQLYNKNFNRKRSYVITIRGEKMFHKFIKDIAPKNPKHLKKYQEFLNSQNL